MGFVWMLEQHPLTGKSCFFYLIYLQHGWLNIITNVWDSGWHGELTVHTTASFFPAERYWLHLLMLIIGHTQDSIWSSSSTVVCSAWSVSFVQWCFKNMYDQFNSLPWRLILLLIFSLQLWCDRFLLFIVTKWFFGIIHPICFFRFMEWLTSYMKWL